MKYLSQRDSKWSQIKLGNSNLTIGRFGCTTTCISMLSDYFGCYKSPDQIANTKEFYTQDGLINWNNLKFDKMLFTGRAYQRLDDKIQEILKNPDKACILQVDNGQHWVVPIKRTLTGSYIACDPWTGLTCDVIKTYKNITGFACFNRK